MMDFSGTDWDLLQEIAKMPARECLNWLTAHGVSLEECDCGDDVYLEDVNLDGDFDLFIGGYWSDFAPHIEFENGRVARWYRDDCWD